MLKGRPGATTLLIDRTVFGSIKLSPRYDEMPTLYTSLKQAEVVVQLTKELRPNFSQTDIVNGTSGVNTLDVSIVTGI